jgi:hypothetical protein
MIQERGSGLRAATFAGPRLSALSVYNDSDVRSPIGEKTFSREHGVRVSVRNLSLRRCETPRWFLSTDPRGSAGQRAGVCFFTQATYASIHFCRNSRVASTVTCPFSSTSPSLNWMKASGWPSAGMSR